MTANAKPHKDQPPKSAKKRKASARTPVSLKQRRRASGRGGRGR